LGSGRTGRDQSGATLLLLCFEGQKDDEANQRPFSLHLAAIVIALSERANCFCRAGHKFPTGARLPQTDRHTDRQTRGPNFSAGLLRASSSWPLSLRLSGSVALGQTVFGCALELARELSACSKQSSTPLQCGRNYKAPLLVFRLCGRDSRAPSVGKRPPHSKGAHLLGATLSCGGSNHWHSPPAGQHWDDQLEQPVAVRSIRRAHFSSKRPKEQSAQIAAPNGPAK